MDIDTKLTLLSAPLTDMATNRIYGGFQVVYSRNVDGFFMHAKTQLSKNDYEVIDFVSMQLTHSLMTAVHTTN